eukprot:COSAG05_NODE_894_length_6706_cov_13.114424_3_plen_101_part_00
MADYIHTHPNVGFSTLIQHAFASVSAAAAGGGGGGGGDYGLKHLTNERARAAWDDWKDLGPRTDYDPLARAVSALIEALLSAVDEEEQRTVDFSCKIKRK